MNNDTIKLLNLEHIRHIIKAINVTKNNDKILCYITLLPTDVSCPLCGGTYNVIKDYQKKRIIHSVINDTPLIIIYKARRYKCKYCNNIFYEFNPFALKYCNCSSYTIVKVLKDLRDHTKTFTSVARDSFISPHTVMNIFDNYVDCHRRSLPKVLCFDEVYSSKKLDNKYAFVMTDFIDRKIVDICPSRRNYRLSQYFTKIPKHERDNVKFIVIDMWKTYKDLSERYFYSAKIAVDSFHVIKHLNDAMKAIRIRIMNKYDRRTKSLQANDMYYYMLKKFHYFFTKNFDDIYSGKIKIPKIRAKWDKYAIMKYLLSIDDDLTYAYQLKEEYREFNATANYDNCDDDFDELIDKFCNSRLEDFRDFGMVLVNWKEYIKNSFIRVQGRRLSNGPAEGLNSLIKTLMKESNGFINFRRFRNRVMYSINKDVPIKGSPDKK